MNPFIIRTALPFGYLVFAAVFVSLGVAGLVLLCYGVWRRQYRRATTGAVIGMFVAYVAWVNIAAGGALNLNPAVSPDDLTGRWSAGEAELILRPNGRYECVGRGECEALGVVGVWRLNDGDVTLLPVRRPNGDSPVSGGRYRVAIYGRTLRLSSPIDEDPDTWDGRLFWELRPPASRSLTITEAPEGSDDHT